MTLSHLGGRSGKLGLLKPKEKKDVGEETSAF